MSARLSNEPSIDSKLPLVTPFWAYPDDSADFHVLLEWQITENSHIQFQGGCARY